jgi:serine/threonine protein kinase
VHQSNIIHRNIKASNIFLTNHGIKLGYFDVSKMDNKVKISSSFDTYTDKNKSYDKKIDI